MKKIEGEHTSIPKEYRRNLKKLADYLAKGSLMAEFDMDEYSDERSRNSESKNCGSVGCAIGHGPYAGIKKNIGERWSDYTDRCFGGNDDMSFMFLFDYRWSKIDNTAKGAANRIRYALKYGAPEMYRHEWKAEYILRVNKLLKA